MAEPWKPHAGQRKAVRYLVEHAAAGLFADPGVGKTSTVYAAFEYLRRRGLARRMLVIAPLRPAQLVWPAEREKWKDFQHLRVEVLHGPKKDAALARESDVCVINPEGLDWLIGAVKTKTRTGKVAVSADLRAFKALGFDTLVVDELTNFKHTNSVRFKTLKAVLDTFGRRWGLTGTPAPNGLIDLFGQCFVLDQGRSLGPYVTHYRSKYFLPGYDGFSWVLRKGAEEEIYERLKPLVLRLRAEDYVDMPDLVENTISFELPPEARKVYDHLEEELIVQLGEDVVTAANAAAATTKLRQVASGGLYLEADTVALFKPAQRKGREWAMIHDEKTELLAELVDELQGTPLLVAYDFKHDLERIQRRWPDVPYLGGGVTERRARELEAAWNAGELPLLLGHPSSIGHGLNLQAAGNHVCWYSLTYDREKYDQLNARVRRQGSRHARVFVHHLVAKGTVDEVIGYALRRKAKVQTALLEALRGRNETSRRDMAPAARTRASASARRVGLEL